MAAPTQSNLPCGFRGDILMPSDLGYDAARQCWNDEFNTRRPKMVLLPRGAADVCKAINWLRENKLDFTVMGGGHSFSGRSLRDGAVLIRLSKMQHVHVDVEEQTAWVGMGATVADFDAETTIFGLCGVGGHVSHTGMAGFALHGGFGCISRRYGLASDNILAARVVLSDGRFLEASATEHADLFWALCGAGSFMGIVTEIKVRLFPLPNRSDRVYAGQAFWLADSDDVFRERLEVFREMTAPATCDPNFSCSAFWANPPMEPFNGRRVFLVHTIWLGDESMEQAEVILKQKLLPLMNVDPLLNNIRVMPFTEFNSLQDPLAPYGLKWISTAGSIKEWGDNLIDVIMELEKFRPPPSASTLEHWGGAISASKEDKHDIFARVRQEYAFLALGMVPAPELQDSTKKYIENVKTLLPANGYFPSAYVNYNEDRSSKAYAPYERLAQVKAIYDTAGLFPSIPV